MSQIRRSLFLGVILLGTQLSTGCYLGYTSRPVLFPNVALSPAVARPGTAVTGCGPSCYREFGSSGCGGSLFGGPAAGTGPVVTGPVYDAPVTVLPPYYPGIPVYGTGFTAPAPTAGCAGCATNAGGYEGVPIAGSVGGPPIAVSPAGGSIHGVPYDSGAVPTLKPPGGSIPLQMPNEVKESKKIAVTSGK